MDTNLVLIDVINYIDRTPIYGAIHQSDSEEREQELMIDANEYLQSIVDMYDKYN